jgi:hypothetical protein
LNGKRFDDVETSKHNATAQWNKYTCAEGTYLEGY